MKDKYTKEKRTRGFLFINMTNFKLFSIIVILFILLLPFAFSEVTIEKILDNETLKVGDNVEIKIKLDNNYDENVNVRIADSNIIGSSGIDIQCIEYNIPPGESIIEYDKILAYEDGKFTLQKAELKYNDINSKEEKVAYSNEIDLDIKPNENMNFNNVIRSSVTTIYRCDGINMQSTSSSQESKQQSNAEKNSKSEEEKDQMQQKQDMMQNNQMNQDASGLKQQASNELQKQNNERQEFGEQLAKDEELMNKNQEMLNKGYQMTKGNANPTSNNSGSFDFQYENKEGDKASIKGSMENGKIEDLGVFDKDYENNILEKLKDHEEFRKFEKTLKKEGFNFTDTTFEHINSSFSNVALKYNNSEGNEVLIEAEYINETIENILLVDERNKSKEGGFLLSVLRYLFFILLVFLGLFIFYRYLSPKKETDKIDTILSKKRKKEVDYLKEALILIEKAELLFKAKKEKDAYEKVSFAIRFYFSYKIGLEKDITAEDLLRELNRINYEKIKDVKKILDLCQMVEFAKHSAKEKSFREIVTSSKILIV